MFFASKWTEPDPTLLGVGLATQGKREWEYGIRSSFAKRLSGDGEGPAGVDEVVDEQDGAVG